MGDTEHSPTARSLPPPWVAAATTAGEVRHSQLASVQKKYGAAPRRAGALQFIDCLLTSVSVHSSDVVSLVLTETRQGNGRLLPTIGISQRTFQSWCGVQHHGCWGLSHYHESSENGSETALCLCACSSGFGSSDPHNWKKVSLRREPTVPSSRFGVVSYLFCSVSGYCKPSVLAL